LSRKSIHSTTSSNHVLEQRQQDQHRPLRSKSPLDKAYTNKPSSYNKNPNSKEIDEEEAIAYQEFLATCPSSERVDEPTFRLAGVLRDKI